jgi:hypothetical protein
MAPARRLAAILLLVLALTACGGGGDKDTASPTPGPTASATPAVALGDGSLAVGITEPNPNLFWRGHDVPPAFARWRDALDALHPSYYRIVVDWPSLQPGKGAPLRLDTPAAGCMRAIQPCAAWDGVRDQLRALASQQKAGAGWQALVVLSGTPSWAAASAGDRCERKGTQARSHPPASAAGLAAYRELIGRLLAAAKEEGATLRYWSPWNEPNHPYWISPQRTACRAKARSVSVAPYVAMARAMRSALDAAPGDQELVLGETAGLVDRRPTSTSVAEFIDGIPKDVACDAVAWGQHGYVGGDDPVPVVERAYAKKGCGTVPPIWITETGAGGTRIGASRGTSAKAQTRACRAMARQLQDWYADPRVAAAFQYTLREDDLFPVGLVTPDLAAAYPTLALWTKWGLGARPDPRAEPASASACGSPAPSSS